VRGRNQDLIAELEKAGPGGIKAMKDSAKYAKIVAWLQEDQCYVGSAPVA